MELRRSSSYLSMSGISISTMKMSRENASLKAQPALDSRAELARKIANLMGKEENRITEIPGVSLHRRTAPTPPCRTTYHPGVIVVAQGSKQVNFGRSSFTYDESHFVLTAVDLPIVSWVPVERIPGVGKVTAEKLAGLEIKTVADLRKLELGSLEKHFGRFGVRLHSLARGIDENAVIPDRPTKSVSAEDTFEKDVTLADTGEMIRRLAEKTWTASRKESRAARTVVLKLKTSDFKILTRSCTPSSPPSSLEELTEIALSLREKVGLNPKQRFRLVGVGLSNFDETNSEAKQPELFD